MYYVCTLVCRYLGTFQIYKVPATRYPLPGHPSIPFYPRPDDDADADAGIDGSNRSKAKLQLLALCGNWPIRWVHKISQSDRHEYKLTVDWHNCNNVNHIATMYVAVIPVRTR